MADRPRIPQSTTVARTERLGASFVRVVLHGGDLQRWTAPEHTDAYVKVVCLSAGVDYPRPLDLGAVRDVVAPEHLPKLRTYTVRAYDADRDELVLDVLVHGDEGLGGPWAAQARPGDEVLLMGPGGAYSPDPAADWHLLVGDESALPAIAVALERLPASAVVHALVEVRDQGDRAALSDPRVTWVEPDGTPGAALVRAVQSLDFPDGVVHAFVHGEAGWVRTVRRHLRLERAVPTDRLSVSGYWRAGVDDEGWRAQKRDWIKETDAQDAEAVAT